LVIGKACGSNPPENRWASKYSTRGFYRKMKKDD